MQLDQRTQALQVANSIRTGRRLLREQVRDGHTTIADLLEDVPELIHGMPLIEVMMLAHRTGWRGSKLEVIGRQAARDGVNLLQAVDRASDRSRGWAARHAPPPTTRGPRRGSRKEAVA